MNSMKKYVWIRIVPVLVVLAFIWGNSMLSAEASTVASNAVGSLLSHIFTAVQAALRRLGFDLPYETVVRKTAHLTEYAVLGFLTGWAFLRDGFHLRLKLSAPLCAAAAIIDECIQRFSSGRAPRVTDVLIDWTGAALGLAVTALVCYLVRRHRKTKTSGDT